MGSGCKQTPISNFCVEPVSSNCVLYKGDPVPILGICTGDTITEVEKAIIDKLLQMLEGTGITLPNVTLENCQYLNVLFANKDKTISNLIQLLIDSNCSLKGLVDQINAKINQTGNNFVLDFKCIPTPSEISIDSIVQAIINSHCLLKADVDNLKSNAGSSTLITQIVNSLLGNLITGPTGVKKTVTDGVTKYEMLGMVPIGGCIPYDGALSSFDASGKGLPGTEVENWHICNGLGGTRDWRGLVLVGAIQGVGGGTLSGNVDPSGNQDATMNYSPQDRGGSTKTILGKEHLPNYQITTTDVKVSSENTFPLVKKWNRMQDSNSRVYSIGDDYSGGDPANYTLYLKSTSGTVTFNLGGGGKGHDNRMPYEAVIWIKRIA
jgi:hypothetical protein